MKNIIILTFLLPFILSFSVQKDNFDYINSNKHDSVIIKGRIIEERKSKNPKYIQPVEGVVVIFLDSKYKDLLINDPVACLKDTTLKSKRNYVFTDNNGYFECKLTKANYVATSNYLGYENMIVDITPDSKIVDLGDIELKDMVFDGKDETLKITNWNKIKLFFRKWKVNKN